MGEPSSPVQLSGLILGNYRLEQPVEQHPWGPAFLARDKKGMAYLVRFIDLPLYEWAASERSERAIFLGRLQQEANRVALLRHPHILPLLDYGNHRGIPYLVYPYAQFPSLRSLLKRPVSSDLVSIGRYLDQIASALAYAHERAVLHRNLSTRCIFLQSPQHLMVADFGLMYMHQIGKQLAEIAHGKQQGPVYDGSSESSAPESLLNRPPEVATDVYALGAVLYRMLTGYPPFNGKTPEMVAQQHLSAQVPPLATWRPGLPAELDQVIGRALAKEPSARFQSPMALAEAYYQAVALGERPTRSYTMPGPLVPATSDPLDPGEPVQHAAQETGSGQKVSRRSFVMAGLGASAVAVVAAVVLIGRNVMSQGGTPPAAAQPTQKPAATPSPQAKATQKPAATPSPAGNRVLARANDVPLNSAKTFPIADQQNPGLLIHLPDDKFVAFDSTCTHAACAVSYNQGTHLLDCPCHGSIFDPAKDAAVVQGPATSPLAAVKINVQPDGTITTA